MIVVSIPQVEVKGRADRIDGGQLVIANFGQNGGLGSGGGKDNPGLKGSPVVRRHWVNFEGCVGGYRMKLVLAAMLLLLSIFPAAGHAVETNAQFWEFQRPWLALYQAGRFDEAATMAQARVKRLEESDGLVSEAVAKALDPLALSLRAKGDLAGAGSQYIRVIEIYEQLKIDTPAVCGALKSVGGVLFESLWRSPTFTALQDNVVKVHINALQCYESMSGPEDYGTIRTLFDLFRVYAYASERTDFVIRTAELVQRWQPIIEGKLGPDRIERARFLQVQGALHLKRKAPEQARAAYRRALSIAAKPIDPAKPDRERLNLENDLLTELGLLTRPGSVDSEYMGWQARKLLIYQTLYGPSHSYTTKQQEFLATMKARYPNMPVPDPSLPTPAPVSQAAVKSADIQAAAPKSGNETVLQASAEATRAAKPVWPSDMEPGNLYFLESIEGKQQGDLVLMVAATSAQEALQYAKDSRRKFLLGTARYATGDYNLEHRLIEGGQCIGPIWGAMVANWSSKGAVVWGGGCGKTPALAIEAAFAACEKNRESGCNKSSDDLYDKPRISVALSGSRPWSGYCSTCTPAAEERMGSFNSWSVNRYATDSYMSNAKEAIAQMGKWCDEGSCFQTIDDWFCRENTPDCVDLRLTPNGLSGPRRKPKRQ